MGRKNRRDPIRWPAAPAAVVGLIFVLGAPTVEVAPLGAAPPSTDPAVERARAARPALPADLPLRTVVAGPRYHAGGLHQFFLGREYRPLWLAPITVPVLDLRRVAGGLEPVRRTRGKETLGLVLKGGDGREYRFRSLDKDPTEILPESFHGTFVDDIVQDQIAATFPGGTVVVSPLLQAAGVLHAEPVIVVMPDDPRLGEFRDRFANLPGTFEEHAEADEGSPHTFGAIDIVSGEKMWKMMDEDPAGQPDARAFLRARLVDLLVGDWDRHRDQWRWAKMPGLRQWQPIPEDRDQAFIHFEGVISGVAHLHAQRFASFDEDYADIEDLTFNGRDGDRRILVSLERRDWEAVTADVQERITDEVIAAAVATLPAAYRDLLGAKLEEQLRARRDALADIAGRFYALLARDVDLRGTDRDEVVTIDRHDNGSVAVALAVRGEPAPYRQRLFHPGETKDVRVYLLGGADSVVTTGQGAKINVRVIGGAGDDVVDDRAGARLRVYDESGDNTVLRGAGTYLDERAYTPPRREKAEWIPPRDWGRQASLFPFIGGNSDLGVLFVGGIRTQGYGFRKDPWADRQTLRVMCATRFGEWGADYNGEFRRENSPVLTRLFASATALEFVHFYGFGNETAAPGDEDLYNADVTEVRLEPALVRELGHHGRASVTLRGKYTKSDLGALYGSGHFYQAGISAGWSLDARDPDTLPMQGLRAKVVAAAFPPLASVESTFGTVEGELSYNHAVMAWLVLAARAGGRHVWGDAPFYEAAYLGGAETLRGFPSQRFAGESSAYGTAEVRLPLTQVHVLPPGMFGFFGFYDVGRVFLRGESSDTWHGDGGGGLWIALPDAASMLSVSIAAGDENRIYVAVGMSF